jgi:hypothetical protein
MTSFWNAMAEYPGAATMQVVSDDHDRFAMA